MPDATSSPDFVQIRAPNPGPFTLTGTNTWVVGRDPAYVIDPGPAISEHLAAVAAEVRERGGLGAVLLTHDHHDHSEGIAPFRERLAGPLAAARGAADIVLSDGVEVGPLMAVSTPGHAEDHVAFVASGVAFTGDAVLGSGSVFVAPYPGSMAAYLDGLARLRARAPRRICPGHGPIVEDGVAKLDEYIAHRLERETSLVAALDAGLRGVEELLDSVWADAPAELRVAAAVTLEAHLDKLEGEGRLPEGVERRDYEWLRTVTI